jgi:hypothetical protein
VAARRRRHINDAGYALALNVAIHQRALSRTYASRNAALLYAWRFRAAVGMGRGVDG